MSHPLRFKRAPWPFGLSRHPSVWCSGASGCLTGPSSSSRSCSPRDFARTIIAPSASGQPFFVAGPVEWNARLIAGPSCTFNGLFASIQLALGLGFLFRRRPGWPSCARLCGRAASGISVRDSGDWPADI